MEKIFNALASDRTIEQIMSIRGRRKLYLVGGTIRDILLDIKPGDYDFAVSGSGITFARKLAAKIKGAFVLLSKKDDEARVVKDGAVYDFVGFGPGGIADDLGRRDFTVNAMAVEMATGEFLDPCGGIKDLDRGVIKVVSSKAFVDDPLRVLRGFRFALELGFDIDRKFYSLARIVKLKRTAAERIGYELMRIMSAPDSYKTIARMNDLGIFKQVFPEAKKIMEDDFLWGHSMSTYQAVEVLQRAGFFRRIEPEFSNYFSAQRRKPLLKLAGLFHDVAKPETFLIKEGDIHFYGHDTKGARIIEIIGYKRLKLARSDVAMMRRLVKEHMRPHLLATSSELTDRAIRRFFRHLGDDYFGAMMLAWADGFATAGKTRHLEDTFMRMIDIKRADDAKPKVQRLVNGYDLIALGMKPGPVFKTVLQELYDLQLEGKIVTKDEGLKAARDIYAAQQEKGG
jgi:poly(A) polymerase